ncbi:protein tamozhennic [Cephus cinctus]|uniref:Protein tamozhennic n=1 Tax=Cephus cinctus TaxID=211228 RepID=A0AAJ7CH75_CEPCN|nr:protein tamozhennic [Cephus cinctus]XP_015610499.1 protein tamozhennic [Cephus cinctus]XP_024935815.1 protein tamozhennic [Cephus cinctus]XP_024935816.1 protein tamozhennic [Cephus cinctus]
MAIVQMGKSRDRLQELSMKLEQSHLVYLQTDDSPLKLQQRHKLEGFIKEYLCLVPNDNKYIFQETADILHRSAATVQDFSGYRACTAWSAISLYAANLLAQPWRKEYRTLRTYSGYYKHEVEANLIGAELMFELMGYKHTGLGVLALEGPIDPDKVSSVSRDAIVAFVECQIFKEIWESVSQNFTVSWLEILEFRENHVGTPEQAIRALNYRFLEKIHQSRVKVDSYRDYRHLPQSAIVDVVPTISYHVPSNNYSSTGLSTCHDEYRYLDEGNVSPGSYRYFNPVDSVSLGNRCNTYSYLPADNKYFSGIHGTSYCTAMSTYGTKVPTGRLIELDTPVPIPVANYDKSLNRQTSYKNSDFDEVDSFRRKSNDADRYNYTKVEKKHGKSGLAPIEKDTIDSWDFVYRNLESLGYSKDLGDREDILRKKEMDCRTSRQKSSKSPANNDLDDRNLSQRLYEKKRSRNAFNELDRTNGRSVTNQESLVHKKKSSPDLSNLGALGSTDIKIEDQYIHNKSKKYSQTLPNQRANDRYRTSEQQIAKLADSLRSLGVPPREKHPEVENRWNCSTCTFLNAPNREICEMCGKSKRRGNEDKPLASGGKECPQCTLVNEKNVSTCDACGASLKDSPTYI